jgi:hypothetical protein
MNVLEFLVAFNHPMRLNSTQAQCSQKQKAKHVIHHWWKKGL